MLTSSNYNPDVLTCIANLSSDEVFTPPQLANRILDQFPAELWSDRRATFLDPGCKSGVFLREIAKRLEGSDPMAALSYYQRSLEIGQKLHSSSPTDIRYARNVAIDLGQVASVYGDLGDYKRKASSVLPFPFGSRPYPTTPETS